LERNPILEQLEEYSDNLEKEIAVLQEKRCISYKPLLESLKKQYAFAHFLMYEESVFDTMSQGYKTLLSKALSDVLVIHSTVTIGCVTQSYNIVRSLFETYVNLMYINKNFEANMKYYEDYTIFAQYHKLEEHKNDPDYKYDPYFIQFKNRTEGPLHEKYSFIENNYKERKDWYFIPLSEDIKNHPDLTDREKKKKNINFKTLCEITGNEKMYQKLYPSTSNAAHSTSLAHNLQSQSVASQAGTVISLVNLSIHLLSQMLLVGLNRQIETGHEECEKYLEIRFA